MPIYFYNFYCYDKLFTRDDVLSTWLCLVSLNQSQNSIGQREYHYEHNAYYIKKGKGPLRGFVLWSIFIHHDWFGYYCFYSQPPEKKQTDDL